MGTILKDKKGLLLLLGGVGAVAAGVILRKKAALKCTEIMKEFEETEQIIEDTAASCDDYTEEDRVNDHETNKIQTTINVVKVYTIPYTALVAGGYMILKGTYKICNKK